MIDIMLGSRTSGTVESLIQDTYSHPTGEEALNSKDGLVLLSIAELKMGGVIRCIDF